MRLFDLSKPAILLLAGTVIPFGIMALAYGNPRPQAWPVGARIVVSGIAAAAIVDALFYRYGCGMGPLGVGSQRLSWTGGVSACGIAQLERRFERQREHSPICTISDARGDHRILMTIHRISFGGADRVAILLANALVQAGLPTCLLIFRDGGEGEAAFLKLLDPRVELQRAGPPMGSRHRELLRGYRRLQQLIADWQPAVVLASSNNMGLVTGLATRRQKAGRPRLMMKFTNPVIRPRDWGAPRLLYRKLLYRFVLGQYDRILTLSDGDRATLCELYPEYAERIDTVPNPYVSREMLAGVRPSGISGRARILTSARLMPQKRLHRLLKAFASLRVPEAELVILGDGPLRSALIRYARSLGIDHRVRFQGFVEDVVPWLHDADLFVLSSDYEGFPAAIIEALACGLPVVTTDCFNGARALLGEAPGCAVVGRTDVRQFTMAMESALRTSPDPAALREIAMPYQMDHALHAHVVAATQLMNGPPDP